MGKTPQQLVDELHRSQDKLYTYEYMEVREEQRFQIHMKRYEEGTALEKFFQNILAARSATRRDGWAKLKNEEIL